MVARPLGLAALRLEALAQEERGSCTVAAVRARPLCSLVAAMLREPLERRAS